MSKSVWKFPVSLEDQFPLEMPEGAQPLSVQMQHGQPCLWALVNPDAPRRSRFFRLVGTGHPVEEGLGFVGTFQLNGGALVFHLFEAGGAQE